ncbi:MAG: GNA1162 family protein [Planctomycetota bacterium]
MMRRNIALACKWIPVLLLCVGCAHPLKTRMAEEFDPAKPMRVAVLPFTVKKESQRDGAEKIRRAFAAKLQESNLDVADIPYVDRILAANGWKNVGELQTIPPQELGESLGVDALIYGEVTQWDKFYVVVHAHGAMAAKTDMVDAHTGKWLWTAEKDAIRMKGILKAPVIIYIVPIPPTQFALEGFQMGEMTDEMTREMARPLVDAAKTGPSYAAILNSRPKALSTERALALQKTVLDPDRRYAAAEKRLASSATTATSESKDDYSVQLCATRRPEGAKEFAAALRAKGYAVYTTSADIPGLGRFHRVRIRGFATRQDALDYGFALRAKEGLLFWVDKAESPAQLACW